MADYWLACGASDVASILSEGYQTRRRKYIPLASTPENAISAFARYSPHTHPALLSVNVLDSKIKPRGKGFAMQVMHWPGKCFKEARIVESFLNRIQVLATSNSQLKEARAEAVHNSNQLQAQANGLKDKVEHMQKNEQQLKNKVEELQKHLADEHSKRDCLEKELDKAREERKSFKRQLDELSSEYEQLVMAKHQWQHKEAKFEKQLEGLMAEVEEKITDKFSEHFDTLSDELMSTTTSDDDEHRPSISKMSTCEKYKKALGAGFLFEPELHERNEVFDLATKFIKRQHDTKLRVLCIWKVINPLLHQKFERRCRRMSVSEFSIATKFHGTPVSSAANIIQSGFKLPSKVGSYGRGIYLASDSTKSARYSRGEISVLLVCKVALGKVLVQTVRNSKLDAQWLIQRGHDSVYAPRDSKDTGGVYNDEFVVYREDQVLPAFVVLVEAVGNVAERTKARMSDAIRSKAQNVKDSFLSTVKQGLRSVVEGE